MNTLFIRITFAALALAAASHATAGQELMAVDAQYRAKIAKEKLKMAAEQREANAAGKSLDSSAQCGSQSIGNINTGGRIGAAPREVFVFAPNAINLVGQGGCK